MGFLHVFVASVTLVVYLYVIVIADGGPSSGPFFPLTSDDIEGIRSAFGLDVLKPSGSATDNTDVPVSDGLLAFTFSTLHALDDFLANPILFDIPFEILNTGPLNKLDLVRFLQGLIQFVNSSDFRFIHAGFENRMIECLKDLQI